MNTLHELIERALANEWGMFGHANQSHLEWKVRGAVDGGTVLVVKFDRGMTRFVEVYQLEQIIFDPDFAKALFGDEFYTYECRQLVADDEQQCAMGKCSEIAWQYHVAFYALLPKPERLEYLRRWMEAE